MRQIPPLHLLLAFDAVARTASFNKAADALSISSSSTSHRIRELEQYLGMRLFNRTTRSVSLTSDGARLHDALKVLLDDLENVFSTLKPKRNVVRISALPSFARYRLLPELRQFRAMHPDIFIEISPTTQTVDVDQGEADIAIRFAATAPSVYHCEPLLTDAWFPVAAPAYLEQLGYPSLSVLFRTGEFLSHTRQPWDEWLRAAGQKITRAQKNLTFSDTGFMLDAALNLQGIALARRSLVHRLLLNRSLVRVSDVAIASQQSYFMLASEHAMISGHSTLVMAWIRTLVQDG